MALDLNNPQDLARWQAFKDHPSGNPPLYRKVYGDTSLPFGMVSSYDEKTNVLTINGDRFDTLPDYQRHQVLRDLKTLFEE